MQKKILKRKKSSVLICVLLLVIAVLINGLMNFIDMKSFQTLGEIVALVFDVCVIFLFIKYVVYQYIYIINENGIEVLRTIGKKEEAIIFIPFEKIDHDINNQKLAKRKLNCSQSFFTSKMTAILFENQGEKTIIYLDPTDGFLSLLND